MVRKLLKIASLLVGILVILALSEFGPRFMVVKAQTAVESPEDKGVFVLLQANQLFDSQNNWQWRGDEINGKYLDGLLNRPYIAGATYWVSWQSLEPQDDQYRWDVVDRIIEEVAKRHKKINIGILPAFYPEWVGAMMSTGEIEPFSYHEFLQGHELSVERTRPFPLDPVYLDKYYELMRAISEHIPSTATVPLKNNPNIHYVAVGGPSNGTGLETFIMADNKDGDFAKQRVQELTGQSTFAAGYAFVWQEAIRKFATFFPNKHLAIALSVGITAPSNQPSWHRDSTSAKWIYYYLRSQEYKQDYGNPTHLMTLNLTGKDWMRPGEGNPVQEVVGFVKEAPEYNLTIGFQEVGIAYATATKEERARPFIAGLQKGVNLGASWIEIWPEDFLVDRSHLQISRGWIDQTHPCLNGNCADDGTFDQIIAAIRQVHTDLGGVFCQPQDLNCDGTTNLLDLLRWRRNLVTQQTNESSLLDYLQVLRGWFIQ